jgi:cellulose synthase/poly-beta-1,6-N-acetylglucosamine synthase-like glycosyltransferase
MFELIFLLIMVGYFFQSVIFIIGAKKKFPKLSDDKLPTATIIIAARNEEEKILRTLQSLNKLEYPKGKLQILIVDDQSTDSTGKIIDDFISGKSRFQKITTEEHHTKLIGKMRALAYAIKEATGEIILTTDADCEVKPIWAKFICSHYQDDVAIVTGVTTQTAGKWFHGMQAIDFVYLLTAGAGTTNLNFPISCIGNNMSYRKSAYDEVGGYEKLPHSVTEDFTLMNAIYNLKKYKVIFPVESDSLITSIPCRSLKSLVLQKKRWGVGGLGVPFRGFVIMFWGFTANLLVLLTPFFFSSTWLTLVVFKVALDFFLLYPVHVKLGITKNLKYFFHFEVYYLIYVILLPFIVLPNKKVIWKGREY